MAPKLSVLIPTYNEEENLKSNGLESLYDFLKKNLDSFELLLINDGSSDNTLEGLKNFAKDKNEVRVINEPHRGKAGTLMAGFREAHGGELLFTDFDQSTPISAYDLLKTKYDEGYDVVIGSREIEGAQRKKEPWYRHLMGRGFNFLVKVLGVKQIEDTQCGFKLFRSEKIKSILPKIKITTTPKKHAFTGAFDVELLYLAQKKGLKIAEVPVVWKHVKTKRVSPIKDSIRMFLEVLKIKLADLNGEYN